MRHHLLDYVRCAICKRTAPREVIPQEGGVVERWVELTIMQSFFGMFDFPISRKNFCPGCSPQLGWPHNSI